MISIQRVLIQISIKQAHLFCGYDNIESRIHSYQVCNSSSLGWKCKVSLYLSKNGEEANLTNLD